MLLTCPCQPCGPLPPPPASVSSVPSPEVSVEVWEPGEQTGRPWGRRGGRVWVVRARRAGSRPGEEELELELPFQELGQGCREHGETLENS